MRRAMQVVIVIAAIHLPGCYHAVVNTGRAPAEATVERKWAHSFLAGLVPPEVMDVAAQCPNGVARVETKLSFVNQVAQVVTFGIYSPMTIRVTCAAPGEEPAAGLALVAAPGGLAERLAAAARQSLDRDAAVLVSLE